MSSGRLYTSGGLCEVQSLGLASGACPQNKTERRGGGRGGVTRDLLSTTKSCVPISFPFSPLKFCFHCDGPWSGLSLICLVLPFRATVVEKYKTYWVKIPSPVISQPNALPFSTPEATAAPLSTLPPAYHLTKSVSNLEGAIWNSSLPGNRVLGLVRCALAVADSTVQHRVAAFRVLCGNSEGSRHCHMATYRSE